MREVFDGVYHWAAVHPNTGMEASSYYVEPARTLIDPMAPDEVVEWLSGLAERPERIVLTNRHHYRDSDALRARFDCPVLCHRAGLYEFEGGPDVEGFAFGDELAPGITALEVGVLCEEETALLIEGGGGALSIADGLINYDGIGFVPDQLLGRHPGVVKSGLRDAYARLLDRRFDALLFAHGDPIPEDGKDALREFLESSDEEGE
jgi:hypothetical protein